MLKNLRSILVASALGFLFVGSSQAIPSFTMEPGIRLSSATAQAVILTTSTVTPYRMYFIRDSEIRSALSVNQLDWTEENGIRVSSTTPSLFGGTQAITGCDLLVLNNGGYRMIYTVGDSTGPYGIMITTSADGLAWGAATTSTVSWHSSMRITSPKLTEFASSWIAFFVASHTIYGSISSDEGASWLSTPSSVLANANVGEVAISTRSDGNIRMWYTAPLTGSTTNSVLASGLVGASSVESGVRLSTDASEGGFFNPVVVHSTETYRYRLFYNFATVNSTFPASVLSALTLTPDPQSILPRTVINSDPAQSFVIAGEIFASTPTVSITLGTATITGTAVSLSEDNSITATLDTYTASIGDWSVVVTNPDGQSATLSNALTVTFADAQVDLTETVVRPRDGVPVNIAVTVFNPGHLVVRLYTMDGRLIQKLYDADVSNTTVNIPWYGTNEVGSTVASGTYVLTFEGPKLHKKKKVVVIR